MIEVMELPNGWKVLARRTRYGLEPYRFANGAQADAACARLRAQGCEVRRRAYGVPKYVFVDSAPEHIIRKD